MLRASSQGLTTRCRPIRDSVTTYLSHLRSRKELWTHYSTQIRFRREPGQREGKSTHTQTSQLGSPAPPISSPLPLLTLSGQHLQNDVSHQTLDELFNIEKSAQTLMDEFAPPDFPAPLKKSQSASPSSIPPLSPKKIFREDRLYSPSEVPDLDILDDKERVLWHRRLLTFLACTDSAEEAWEAYSLLLRDFVQLPDPLHSAPSSSKAKLRDSSPPVPYAYLRRLVRLLSNTKPKTRTQFLRLLSVLGFIHDHGGKIHTYEWNALVDNAGKGWRRARPEDYKLAFSVFTDMVGGLKPGTSARPFFARREQEQEQQSKKAAVAKPDIITFTTLLNHAAKTVDQESLRHASALLSSSNLAPDRITHLSMLKHYTRAKELHGVRATLGKMNAAGMPLGLDGLNACLWAYTHLHRVDVVRWIYRVLRHNADPETYVDGEDDVDAVARHLFAHEGIAIPWDMRPNAITYTVIIQACAYHGLFVDMLRVFIDMLQAPQSEWTTTSSSDSAGKESQLPAYVPTLPIFRAIFYGFSKHGVSTSNASDDETSEHWTLPQLQEMFSIFLELPEDTQPSRRTIYWTLMAFAKTSNMDEELMLRAWEAMEARFTLPKTGGNHRLAKLRERLEQSRELASEEDEEVDGA